ncbi:MAG: GntR family transcriptional regulator [Acidimicrobiia bacterium]|jgi:DNA-binding GntR family transcriptional regulator
MGEGSVLDRLRRDILDGVFSPGERLVEVELSERYDCGRAAIRSALLQLESEVLVDRKANKGAAVHRISVEEAIEITEARRALESLVAAMAAQRSTEETAASLLDVIERMRQAVDSDDATAYSRLNRRLHDELLAMSDHAVATDLVRNLRDRGVQNQFRLAMMPGRQKESMQQHAAIVDAVVAGDSAKAAAAMSDHLDSVIDMLSRWADPG